MTSLSQIRCRIAAALACIVLGVPVACAASAPPPAPSAAAGALRAQYAALRQRLAHSDFGRPIVLDSHDGDGAVRGDVHAVVPYPFAQVEAGLQSASSWCAIFMLPYNTKRCAVEADGGGERLSVYLGRKKDTPIAQAFRIDFRYAVAARTPDFLELELNAASGPFGTRDYAIRFEATPLADGRTFLHLSYAYSYGVVSRLAMGTYLSTVGASKIGFTLDGRERDGKPRYVGGMRGVIERNTMRYFLAIDAFLDAQSAPPAERLDKRLIDWYVASERYPRQLHELERDEYLEMKRREVAAGEACCRSPAVPG
jgi:hypothetical protein